MSLTNRYHSRDKERWLKLSEDMTKWLWKAIIACLLLLILSQLAMQNDTIREWLTTADRWEGTRLN